MVNPGAFGDGGAAFNTEFDDQVFEPSPDFKFEDADHMMMLDAFNSQADFALYDMNMQDGFSAGSSLNQQVPHGLPQGYWQEPHQQNFAGETALPQSRQDTIVGDRADSVAQFLGQITPPDAESSGDKTSQSQQAHESDAAKRKERARNAANKRHAKSKMARSGSESIAADEEATEDRGERQAHYREKNRVAAAKCRAKKKDHNDNLEEIHRDEASKNKILKAELMGLRNELAQLKCLTLEHGPDNCRCHGIHEYSMRQANLIARGAAPQYGRQSVSSSVQESPLSIATPASEAASDGLMSAHDQMSPAMGNISRRASAFAIGSWMPST